MKQLIFSALTALFLASCSTTYFQVYKVSPGFDSKPVNDSLIYENEDCRVLYDFWGHGGNAGFVFYNKTNENIYLNKEECFFIFNGFAYNYYQNRVFTQSSNASASSNTSAAISGINFLGYKQKNVLSAGIAATTGSSVAYYEEKVVCIPPETAKKIEGYKVTESLYRDCNLLRFPSKEQIRSSNFSKSESPNVFSNIITYHIGKSEDLERLENEFYVKTITNYPEKAIIQSRSNEFCGEKGYPKKIEYCTIVSPDKFYIEYNNKSIDTSNH
jgi:hypothetical protein